MNGSKTALLLCFILFKREEENALNLFFYFRIFMILLEGFFSSLK